MRLRITICLIAFSLFIGLQLHAQQKLWTEASPADFRTALLERVTQPESYRTMSLNTASFLALSSAASSRFQSDSWNEDIISLPLPDGSMETFTLQDAELMHPDLATRFPELKAYVGKGIDDPTASIRITYSPYFGFNGMILSGRHSTVYIDPITSDRAFYMSYFREDLGASEVGFACLTDQQAVGGERMGQQSLMPGPLGDCNLRRYRLAQSCTGEYAQYHISQAGGTTGTTAGDKAIVQAAMNVTMNRVNGVYERDLGITMQFVANNDAIIYLIAASDPWTGEYNTQTAVTIDAQIGVSNYDIGHNFNTSGGGNAGCIDCVCRAVSQSGTHKGRGYTGRSAPVGDPFDIDYVAHEMGHQFGGYHTQSSSGCRSGNNTEVEPGSASTIMGYAGICAPNVQNNSDDYFAYVNIRDIVTSINSGWGSGCAELITSSNSGPVTGALSNYSIPISTPFKLEGTATDGDDTGLTYCWEENDPENPNSAAAPSPTRVLGPMFRSLIPVSVPYRYFPNINDLRNNVSPTFEVLPSVARTMDFSFTVRDNNSASGCTSSSLMTVTTVASAGPFVVNYPTATSVSWTAFTSENVTWAVANTDLAPVNTTLVDILLSIDGGLTYPITLATGVANDGSQSVTVPNVNTSTARIMVKANGNIFFDISNNDFTIIPGAADDFTLSVTSSTVAICKPANAVFALQIGQIGTFTDPVTLSSTALPGSAIGTFSSNPVNTPGTTDFTISNTASISPGSYPITITGTSTAPTLDKTVELTLIVSETPSGPVTLLVPANSATSVAIPTSFSWTSLGGNGQSYDIDIALDAGFVTIVDNASGLSSNAYMSPGLSVSTQYYWRVRGSNDCGAVGNSATFSFTTSSCTLFTSADVPKTISASGTPTVTSTLTIATAGTVQDLDVRNLVGTHSWMSDLTIRLTSPLGTVVTLFSGICGNNDNFDLEFDNAAAAGAIPCPPTTGLEYQSSQALSAFNGESVTGIWTLTIVDGANGDGGTLTSWALDICLGAPPMCQQPSALTASNISTNGADLSWTEVGAATLWNIEIGATPFTPDQNPEYTGVGNPFLWTDGNASTTYEYYVQSDCGLINGTSAWSGPYAFTTSADYCGPDPFVDSGGISGNYTNNENVTTTVICPDTPGDVVTVTFNLVDIEVNATGTGSQAGCWDYLTIYDGENTSAPIIAATLCGEQSGDGGVPSVPSSLLSINDSFTSTNPNGCLTFTFFSDNSQVEQGWEATVNCATITCPQPFAGSVGNVSIDSADLLWTEAGTSSAWSLEWGPAGFAQGTGTLVPYTSNNPYELSGLTENTDYDFYVQSICGVGDSSAWSGPFSFATLIGSNTPCVGGFAGIYPCDNYDLQGHLTIAELGGGGTVEGNDIWGWTDPMDNKEYAIMGLTTGTVFIDISDPLNPVYLGRLPTQTSNSIWRDIKVYQNHAFIVSEASGHGMQVFDLTRLRNVTSPPEIFTVDAHYAGFGNCHNIVINEATGYAYAVGTNQNSGGLHFINIQNPVAPIIGGPGFSDDGYTHDAQVVIYSGPDVVYQGREIAFASNEDTFTIVDVDDKSDAQQISRTGYAGSAYTHQGWVTEDHQYFLMNDELDEQNNSHNTRTYIWNIQDLDNPVFMGYYQSSVAAIDHNNYVKGDTLYQANYRGGLRVLDLTDVSNGNLTEVGFFDVYPSSNTAQFNGAWSNYPYFSSGNIIISSIEDGLFIVKASPPPPCSVSAIVDGGSQSACVPATDTYSNDVTVTFADAPTTGDLIVNGQSFTIGTSPQTVTLTNLPSDGNTVDVTASFSADPLCTLTVNSVFTAPVSCADPACSPDVTPPLLMGECGSETANLASYDNGWQSGDGDIGLFGTWSLATSNGNPSQAGHFIGSSGFIDIAGESWGMYANSSQLSEAYLTLDNELTIGSSLSLAMDNGSINSGGTVGIGLRNETGQNLWEFFFVGGASNYTVNDGSGASATGLSFTDQGLTIEVFQSSATTLDYVITKLSDSSTISGTSTLMTPGSGSQTISQVRFFNFNAGGIGANDAFFNTIEVCHPCPADVVASCTDYANTTITGIPVITDYCDGSPVLDFSDAVGACSAGTFTVVRTFTGTDVSMNTLSCDQTITVTDNVLPNAVCQNVTVNLDGSGNGILTPAQVDNGSSDGCSTTSLTLDMTTFDCDDVALSPITVMLTVTDACGNSSTCTSQVTVIASAACNTLINDDCNNSILVSPSLLGYSLWDTVSVGGASQTLPACIGNADDDTWFSWLAQSSNDIVIVQDVGSTSDMVIEIFDGCGGTSLGCFDNYGAGQLERAWVGGLTVGNTYYFRTYDKAAGGPASGQIRLLVKTFAQGGIRDIYCGITNYQLSSWFTPERQDLNQLYPYTTVAAAGYQVKLTDQSTNIEYTKAKLGSQSQYFQFSNFVGIPFNALFDAQARHAVSVPANGTVMTLWSEYGPTCTMGLGAVTQSSLRPEYCTGAQDYGLGDQVLAVYVPNATAYRFTFFDGVNTHTRIKVGYGLFLHDVPGLEYGKTYQVTVETQVNGQWSLPGDVCVINMLVQPPSTEVRAQYCNGTYLFPQSNFLLAETVYGADQFQWRFTPILGGSAMTDHTGTLSFAFNTTTIPFVSGATYNVEVRARVMGIWGDYAESCPITIQANPGVNNSDIVNFKLSNGKLKGLEIYPNPNDGEEVMVVWKGTDGGEAQALAEVLDLTGRVVQSQAIAVKGQDVSFKLQFDYKLLSGVYFIRISRNGETLTERVIIE